MEMTEHTSEYGTTQIVIKDSGINDRKVLLTRFKGERTWAVRGFQFVHWANEWSQALTLHDGNKEQFIKSRAIEIAERWIQTGWMYH